VTGAETRCLPTSKDKRKKKRKKPDRRNDLLEEKRCRPYPAMA
jgi:hypothetical protein